MTQGGQVKHDTVVATLHNLAVCYQKTGDLAKSAAYIEACIYNVSTYKVFNAGLREMHVKIKVASYLAKLNIHACAELSQLNDHRHALESAKKAVKFSISMIKLTLQSASSLSSSYTKHKNDGKKLLASTLNVLSIISLANPALRCFEHFLANGRIKTSFKLPSVLGVKDYPEWASQLSLKDLLLMQPLSVEDLQDPIGVQTEFTKDILLMKAAVLAVSYFCVSTELQFLQLEPETAEALHEKALKLIGAFFPEQSLLRMHLSESFRKRFRFSMNEIVKSKQREEDGSLEFKEDEDRLPTIKERPASLTPKFKFKKIRRRASERPKTVSNFESVGITYNRNKTPKNPKTRVVKFKK
jgi:tetratricopeptide (TPR) repeat protein